METLIQVTYANNIIITILIIIIIIITVITALFFYEVCTAQQDCRVFKIKCNTTPRVR